MKKTRDITLGLSPAQERIMSILEYKKIQIIMRKELIELIKKYVLIKDVQDLIEKLQKKKRIIPIVKGVYAVIPLSSINKVPQLSDLEIINYFLEKDYYIGNYNAFNKHGFTEQIPNMLFVYNTKYSGNKQILNFRVKFFKIKKEKLFGIIREKYPYSDKERTIIDVLENPEYMAPLSDIFDKIKENNFNREKFINYSIKYKSIKIMKLAGLLTDSPKIMKILKRKNALSYYTTLKKTGTKQLDKKWKIRLI